MPDSFQKVSTLPIPKHQTQETTRNPLPISSPEDLQQSFEVHHDQSDRTRLEDFRAYLEHSSITNQRLNTRTLVFDTAQDISQNSIYHHPLDKPPP